MTLTPVMFLIVCPLVFLASFVDAIAGGGGIISLPAYLFAGLPMYNALATNKLSSSCGGIAATTRFIKHQCCDLRLVPTTVAAALLGAAGGASLALQTDEKILQHLLLIVLPVIAVIVFRKRNLIEDQPDSVPSFRFQLVTATVASLIVGSYDGFYGPGTGTFLVLIFTGIVKLDARRATGNVKCVNLASNLGALITYIHGGKVIFALGAVAAVCGVAGGLLGSGMVMRDGAKIVRPIILVVLILLFVKILSGY